MGSINDQQDLPEDSELLLSDEETEESTKERRGSSLSQLSWSSQLSESYAKAKRSWVLEEAVKLFKLAVPIVLTLFFQQLLFFISLIFVGHISGTLLELDAAALAFSFVNVTGVSVGFGLSTAADTLCSQSYGFKNYKRVGIILQRELPATFIASFPGAQMYGRSAWKLHANKQDLPNAMSVDEITEHLKLKSLKKRAWYIQGTSATKGDDGLYEGLSWVQQQVTGKQVKKAVTKPIQETGDSVAKKSGLFSSWFSALGSYFASTSTPVSE